MSILRNSGVVLVLYFSATLGLLISAFALFIALYYGYPIVAGSSVSSTQTQLDGVVYGLLFNLSATVCMLPIGLLLGSAEKPQAKKKLISTALSMCAVTIGWYLFLLSIA